MFNKTSSISNIRFTPEDRAIIEDLAQKENRTLSNFIYNATMFYIQSKYAQKHTQEV